MRFQVDMVVIAPNAILNVTSHAFSLTKLLLSWVLAMKYTTAWLLTDMGVTKKRKEAGENLSSSRKLNLLALWIIPKKNQKKEKK